MQREQDGRMRAGRHEGIQTMKRYGIPLLLIVLAFVGYKFMAGLRTDQSRRPPSAFVRTVSTTVVRYGDVRPPVTATGRVRALEQVSLTPEVTGTVKGSGFALRKGTSFRKGQVLMRIDSRQALYAVQSTVSDLQNALAALLPELKVDMPDAYERWSAFFNQVEGTTLPDIPETSSEREKLLVTRYNVYKLYYTAGTQKVTLGKHTLRAPFTGTVEDASVYPASMARAGSPVATISRTDIMEIELALTQQEAGMVERGAAVALRAEGLPDTIRATVHRVGEALDERMQTVPVFVRVTGAVKAGLRPGMYATATITSEAIAHAQKIPRKALHNGVRVYTVEDGALQERVVSLAYTGLESAYLTGGLDEGDTLIIEPLQDAVLGMAVRPSGAHPSEPPARGSGVQDKRGGE